MDFYLGSTTGSKEEGSQQCWEKGDKLLMALNKDKAVGLSSRRMLLKKSKLQQTTLYFLR